MKAKKPSQIPLDLSYDVSLQREDLIESDANRTAIAMVDAWPDWPGNVTVLAGPVGSGKSHIAAVWAGISNAVCFEADEVPKQQEEIVDKVVSGQSVLIENLERGFQSENSLFHLLNALKEAGGYCLITSRSWPKEWDIDLADLRSRLMAAQLVELSEPDDLLLGQVMMKLFSDRQITVDAGVIDYCVLRMERSLGSAAKLVEEIDRTALSTGRTISRKTAAQALAKLGMA